ncbi:MAG: PKD domain-containing protein [Bacteroidetes bacterium]|nr:PKD domain-containing protein [Bacteroidota bacterium]
MKEILIKQVGKPGKSGTLLFSLIVFIFSQSFAQSNCVKADFGFYIDQNSKSVKFEAKASSNAVAFEWDFGDGKYGKGQNEGHQYAKAGEYKVCLTAWAFDSSTKQRCSTTVCKKLVIPDCDLKADFEVYTDGNQIKANAKSNGKTPEYYWSFGDGSGAKGNEVKHEYSGAGKYEICLGVKDSATGCAAKICKTVEIRKCNLEADFEFAIDGSVVKLLAKSNSKNAHYIWRFSDGSDARGREMKHEFSKEGKYEICLLVIDTSEKCEAKICKSIEIRKCNLAADFEFSGENGGFKFRAKANEQNAAFEWDYGDGTYGKGTETSHQYKHYGSFRVCLTVYLNTSSAANACKITICKLIEIPCKIDTCHLKADFKFSTDGKEVKAVGNASDDKVLYYWSWGDGSADVGREMKHKYNDFGVYEICLTAFNPKTHCTITTCKKVVFEKPCHLRGGFKYTIANNKVIFKARGNSKDAEYAWKFGDGDGGTGKVIKHEYSKPGIYEVTLFIYDKTTGCKLEIHKKLIINPFKKHEIPAENSGEEDKLVAAIEQNSTTSTVQIAETWTATAFPVPTQNAITFTSDQKVITHATIYTMDGTEVLNAKIDGNSQQEIDITILPTGFYYAKVTAEDGTVKTVRFIKN